MRARDSASLIFLVDDVVCFPGSPHPTSNTRSIFPAPGNQICVPVDPVKSPFLSALDTVPPSSVSRGFSEGVSVFRSGISAMRAWVLMFSREVAALAEMVKLAIKDPEVGSIVKGALVYDDRAVYEITLCETVARWLT